MPGDGAKDRIEGSESEGMVVWNRDPMVSRLADFHDDVATDLMHGQPGAHRKRREESSCHQEDFVADKVEANSFRTDSIKIERGCRLKYVHAQLVPRVRFSENAFREAFGAVTAIGLLNLEDQFSNTSRICMSSHDGWIRKSSHPADPQREVGFY